MKKIKLEPPDMTSNNTKTRTDAYAAGTNVQAVQTNPRSRSLPAFVALGEHLRWTGTT